MENMLIDARYGFHQLGLHLIQSALVLCFQLRLFGLHLSPEFLCLGIRLLFARSITAQPAFFHCRMFHIFSLSPGVLQDLFSLDFRALQGSLGLGVSLLQNTLGLLLGRLRLQHSAALVTCIQQCRHILGLDALYKSLCKAIILRHTLPVYYFFQFLQPPGHQVIGVNNPFLLSTMQDKTISLLQQIVIQRSRHLHLWK